VHVDVMDGHFVPNITIGPAVVAAIRPHTAKVLDVHLMIAPCDAYLEPFAEAGADFITVHAEAGPHLDRSLQLIRALGKKAGVSITPATPANAIWHVLDRVDLVLVMTVNPGFGGQTFIPAMVDKLFSVRAMIGDRPIHLEVDGGITVETAAIVAKAGADVLVAGSAVFKGKRGNDYGGNIADIRASATAAI
jgi:ribulose-phosphate 3-epimerase